MGLENFGEYLEKGKEREKGGRGGGGSGGGS